MLPKQLYDTKEMYTMTATPAPGLELVTSDTKLHPCSFYVSPETSSPYITLVSPHSRHSCLRLECRLTTGMWPVSSRRVTLHHLVLCFRRTHTGHTPFFTIVLETGSVENFSQRRNSNSVLFLTKQLLLMIYYIHRKVSCTIPNLHFDNKNLMKRLYIDYQKWLNTVGRSSSPSPHFQHSWAPPLVPANSASVLECLGLHFHTDLHTWSITLAQDESPKKNLRLQFPSSDCDIIK